VRSKNSSLKEKKRLNMPKVLEISNNSQEIYIAITMI
jgi:hypothetical protein